MTLDKCTHTIYKINIIHIYSIINILYIYNSIVYIHRNREGEGERDANRGEAEDIYI
jgi:hypothetical protein